MTKTKLKNLNSQKAFTLVEFTIYIAVIGVMSVLMIGFLWNIIFGDIKETAYQEVQQNARFALAKMTQEIKKATEINSPLPGNSADSLSLTMGVPHLNPTLLDVANGKLRINQGTGGPYELTSNQVIVSSLKFINLSYQDTPGTVRIEMTIDHVNPSSQTEYQASVSLKSTIALASGGAAFVPHLTQLNYRWRNDDGSE